MAEHHLLVVPRDISGMPRPAAASELSSDGGDNWRALTGTERQSGIVLNAGDSVVVRVRERGSWEICQGLAVETDGENALVWSGNRDFGALSLEPAAAHDEMSVCLSLFRDAMPDRIDQGNNPPPAYMYTLLAFGENVLASGGSGLERLAANLAVNVLSFGPDQGELLFVKAPADSALPQECAVFVPRGLDLAEPVPIHVFLSPSTGGKKLPYPYSDGDDSFNAMLHNYLIGGGKRFLSQHVASGKRCVFVFPLPSPKTYFTSMQTAQSLRKFCLELVYYLRRLRQLPIDLVPSLGPCALSGFSEGGRPLAAVIGSSPAGTAFPELEELYLLDVMPPSGSSNDIGSYHRLMGLLNGWWANGKGQRKVRFYSQFYSFGVPLAVRGTLAQSNRGAVEFRGSGTTCLYSPKPFWTAIGQEQTDANPSPGYDFDNVHQLMPCLFLQHALRNSGFPDT